MEMIIMTYAYVQNGTVMTTRANLPSSWMGVSGFNNSSLEFQINYGWYPLVYADAPVLNLDQYFGAEEFTVEAERVVSSRPVITRTVDEIKVWIKNIGKRVAENSLQNDYPLQYQILGLTGSLGAAYKTAVEASIAQWIGVYNTFAAEVDACTTKLQLLNVWNSYPQLQEEAFN